MNGLIAILFIVLLLITIGTSIWARKSNDKMWKELDKNIQKQGREAVESLKQANKTLQETIDEFAKTDNHLSGFLDIIKEVDKNLKDTLEYCEKKISGIKDKKT